jgi:hypothetical protein
MTPSEKNIQSEVISVKEYIDLKLTQEKELREEWRVMNDKLVDMAKDYVQQKLEKMNEMREQINLERGQYLSRGEFMAEHKALDTKVGTMEKILANYQGRLVIIGGVWGAVIFLLSHFWKG